MVRGDKEAEMRRLLSSFFSGRLGSAGAMKGLSSGIGRRRTHGCLPKRFCMNVLHRLDLGADVLG